MAGLRWPAPRMNFRSCRSSTRSIRFSDSRNARLASPTTVGGFVRCITGWTRLQQWLKRRLATRWSRNCSPCRENADLCAASLWSQKHSRNALESGHPIGLPLIAPRSFIGCQPVRKRLGRSVLRKGVSIMLVLTRKNRESVVVGGSNAFEQLLKVTVLEIRRGKVTLGIEGDRDVPVYRCEIWDRICAGKRSCEAHS